MRRPNPGRASPGRRGRRRGPLAIAAAVALALVPALVLAQTTATVGVGGNGDLGDFLVGPNGLTLYVFANDEPGKSNCYGQCEINWPPLVLAAGEQPTAGDGVGGELAIAARTDGNRQVTLDGNPLYYWIADSEAGDALGHGVGGVWSVVFVSAQPATAATAAPAAPETGNAGLVARGGGTPLLVALALGAAVALLVAGRAATARQRRSR